MALLTCREEALTNNLLRFRLFSSGQIWRRQFFFIVIPSHIPGALKAPCFMHTKWSDSFHNIFRCISYFYHFEYMQITGKPLYFLQSHKQNRRITAKMVNGDSVMTKCILCYNSPLQAMQVVMSTWNPLPSLPVGLGVNAANWNSDWEHFSETTTLKVR